MYICTKFFVQWFTVGDTSYFSFSSSAGGFDTVSRIEVCVSRSDLIIWFCWIVVLLNKDDPTNAKNYKPVSVLPGVSKFFEKLMHKQTRFYIDQFLSPYMCGYRKGFSTQHALLPLIEKWKKRC